MKITFKTLSAVINLESNHGIPAIEGEDAEKVKKAIQGKFGMFGHSIDIEDNVHDFDLWHAVHMELNEFVPSVDKLPTPSEIPEGALS